MGQFDAGLTALRRAAELDPLYILSHLMLGDALFSARRYEEAIAAYNNAARLEPGHPSLYPARGFAYYALGDLESARSLCEAKPEDDDSPFCLAIVYAKLQRKAEAQAAFAKLKSSNGDEAALAYAEIFAQWGDIPKALDWLDTAMRVRTTDLERLKTEPLMDPLRQEPRFQAIQRALKFPD
jgi:tetratricopeptide (TPR) repeat protein